MNVFAFRHLADKKEKGDETKRSTRCEKKQKRDATPARLSLGLDRRAVGVVQDVVPAPAPDAAYVIHSRREIVNAILYVLRSGCPWRLLPHDFPTWGTVYDYFCQWQ